MKWVFDEVLTFSKVTVMFHWKLPSSNNTLIGRIRKDAKTLADRDQKLINHFPYESYIDTHCSELPHQALSCKLSSVIVEEFRQLLIVFLCHTFSKCLPRSIVSFLLCCASVALTASIFHFFLNACHVFVKSRKQNQFHRDQRLKLMAIRIGL